MCLLINLKKQALYDQQSIFLDNLGLTGQMSERPRCRSQGSTVHINKCKTIEKI